MPMDSGKSGERRPRTEILHGVKIQRQSPYGGGELDYK